MPVAPKKTADLIKSLCKELGHEDGATACVKKIVQNNWVVDMNDLKQVPIETFEKWGLPLKLCFKIMEAMADEAAADYWKGLNATVNYTLRPKMAKLQSGTVQFMQKRANPKDWAARKMQAYFRKRQRLKAMKANEDEEKAKHMDDAEMEDLLAGEEFKRMDDNEAHQLREQRAKDKIRRAVRRWKARRERKLRGEDVDGGGIRRFSLLLSHATTPGVLGAPKDCEVTDFLMKLGQDELGFEEEKVTGWVRMIVNQHWIENIEDLDLVDDRHWKAWDVPKKFSDKVRERTTTTTGKVLGAAAGGVGFVLGSIFPCLARDEGSGAAWFCKICGTRNAGAAAVCVSCGSPPGSSGYQADSAAAKDKAALQGNAPPSRREQRASVRERRRVSLRRDSEEDTLTF